jgi:hypothetical protein
LTRVGYPIVALDLGLGLDSAGDDTSCCGVGMSEMVSARTVNIHTNTLYKNSSKDARPGLATIGAYYLRWGGLPSHDSDASSPDPVATFTVNGRRNVP